MPILRARLLLAEEHFRARREHAMIEMDDLKLRGGGGKRRFQPRRQHLGLSKSIVSRRIARMEAELGTRLLARTTRGISPTEAGLDFKARSEKILAEFDEAREAVAHQGGEVVGRLRLSAPLSFGVRHVAPVLAQMARRHERLELDVSYSDRIVDLIGERFDAAIRIGALKDSEPRRPPARAGARRRRREPAYLARHGRPGVPGDLAAHECLLYTGRTVAEWQFRVGKRLVSVRPDGLRSDSGEAMLQWAIAGLGIAVVPSFLVTDSIDSGALEPLLLDYPAPEFGIFVVRPPGATSPARCGS